MTTRTHPLTRRRGATVALAAAVLTSITSATTLTPAQAASRAEHPLVDEPVVVAHRGASGYRPEHTLEAYRLAIRMGAEYIEPDLVPTKDGVLVARHENEISGTTDVAERPEFAARRTTKVIDGEPLVGWFTEDFTLAELRTLRAVERLPEVRPENTRYDGRYQVPTFEEVLDLARWEGRRAGRPVGVYAETKHPTYFDGIGLSMEERLVSALRSRGLDRRNAPVYLQSFETENLRDLASMTRVPLVQLVSSVGAPYDRVAAGDPTTYRDMVTPAGLAEIARYAVGVGANKDLVLPRDATGAVSEPSAVVRDAHDQGLLVHVWTMRNENRFMATDFRRGSDPNAHGDARGEILAFLDAGVDGVFADHPDTAVAARDAWLDAHDGAGRISSSRP